MSKQPPRPAPVSPARQPASSGSPKSSDLFRTAFHNSPAIHSVLRASDGVFIEVNETFTRTSGYSREEVLGKTPLDLNLWKFPEKLLLYREELRTKGFVRNFEAEVCPKHSPTRTVLLSSDLVEIEGELYFLSAGVDITERKRVEKIQQATYQISEAAHAAEDLDTLYADVHRIVKGLMAAENFSIAVYDPATDLISFPYFTSERGEQPNRFPPGTGLTGYVLRTGKPLLLDAAMNARKKRAGDNVTFEGFEQIVYRESGEPAATWLGVALSIQGQPIGVMAVQDYENGQAYGDAEKQILTFVATQTALAIDRKRAQQALRESEQKFRALFEGSSQGVMIQDENRFLEVNSATLRILGFDSPDPILGKHPKDTSPPFQPNGERSDVASRRHIAECMERGSARFDWMGLNARGEEVPLEVILTRVGLGASQLIQAVINDISHRKKAEAELQNALAQERELSQLKTDFVSLVSHEFRTPLEIIMSSVDNLDRYHDRLPPEKRQQLLRTINKSVRRMAAMMEEVLVLGRLETERMSFQPESFQLHSFFQKLCDEIHSATASRCPIQFKTEAVPEAGFGDKGLLRHIFSNLLSNAVKYSNLNQPVDFVIQREGEMAVCRVADRGCGIPAADQTRLFQAFHRGSNVRQVPGTGLGLLIVKRCVQLHGGKVSFESLEGQGTTFTVQLPLFTRL